MKKSYQKPFVEKVEFNYANQIVVESGTSYSTNTGVTTCDEWVTTNTDAETSCYHV